MLMNLAYIDPGTGAIVLQILVAAILGIGVVFRRIFIAPFAALFGRSSKSEGTAGDPDSPDSPSPQA